MKFFDDDLVNCRNESTNYDYIQWIRKNLLNRKFIRRHLKHDVECMI